MSYAENFTTQQLDVKELQVFKYTFFYEQPVYEQLALSVENLKQL